MDGNSYFGDDSCVGSLGKKQLRAGDFQFLNQLSRQIRAAMAELGSTRRYFGLIHGDLELPNWVFHRGQARPIDFDMFGLGYYLFDLAQVLWTHAMWEDYEHYRARFLDSYERVCPLNDVERRRLHLFEAIPLMEWISRRLRDDTAEAYAELRKWLPPTLRRLRELAKGP